MPTVQPPPPSPPSPASAQTGQAVAVAVKAPAAVSQLRPGQSLQATQVAQSTSSAQTTTTTSNAPAPTQAQATQSPPPQTQPTQPQATQSLPPNQVQVQTALGPLTLQTQLAIPKGAVLTLVLNRLVPQPQFLITEINGKPVPAAQAALQNVSGASVAGANRLSAQPLSEGARLTATLVRPATIQVPGQISSPPSGQIPGQASGQTPGAPPITPSPQASGQSQTVPGNPATSPTASSPPPTTGRSSTAPATTGSTQTGTGIAATTTPSAGQSLQAPSGTRFTVSIVQVSPPGTALNTAVPGAGSGLAAGSTLSGTVTGTTAQGQPIVQTPHATIALDTTAKIGDGMRVTFKLETAPQLPTTADAAKLGRAGPAESLAHAKSWGQLDEALKALAQIDPTRFQHITQNVLPQPGAKLTSQMLFFLSALKGGDFKAWLGDNAGRVIERDRPGLLGRLGGDFQLMSKLVDEPQSGDWRLALIPLWNNNQLEQLRMYYRNSGSQDDEDGEGDGTRFVLDVELSNIGHVQIDGLMKTQSKKLDLIVRTDQPFPDTWRTDIADIFQTAQEVTGIGGSLAFQAAPGNFIDFPPMQAPSPHPGLFV